MLRANNLAIVPNGEIIRDTYTIVRYLGGGAFGDVYLARHRYMGLQALKMFEVDKSKTALDEAFLLTKLFHQNIVRMFEANDFEVAGQQVGYFTMEYVEGGTLTDWLCERSQPLTGILDVARQLILGLAHAHAQSPSVIHRDLKPTNILINQKISIAKIGDFGLAKSVDLNSKLASAAGTTIYMAPEGFEGHESTASDVYSLGLTIFEMFTGKHPFSLTIPEDASNKSVSLLVQKIRNQQIPRISAVNKLLDAEWDNFFFEVLAFDPTSRPSDASEMLKRFDCLVNTRSCRTQNTHEMSSLELKDSALRAAGSGDLDLAITLLTRACEDPSLATEYEYLLELWKRGIVQ